MNPKDDMRADLDKIINKYSGSELWKEVVYYAVKKNPNIAKEVNLTIKDNKELRASLKDQKYGLNDTKSMRHAMRWPESVKTLLMMADPDHFPMNKENDGEKTMQKLYKILPEFFVVEKI